MVIVAKRGHTNQANVHTPSRLERQNSNWSSKFGCNWTSFHSPPKKGGKKKEENLGVETGDQKPETFSPHKYYSLLSLICQDLFVNWELRKVSDRQTEKDWS